MGQVYSAHRFHVFEGARLTARCSVPNNQNRRSRGEDAGFTLIELMVAIAVIAILLAIAVPSFVSFTQTNRVAAEVNSLAGDLQFARAEAIKEGQPVSLCAANAAGTACAATAGAWQGGWIVFSDPNQNQTVDAGEPILRRQIPWKSTDTFTASNSISAISYSRDGFAIGLGGIVGAGGVATWTLQTSPVNAAACRQLIVNIVGHQQVQPC